MAIISEDDAKELRGPGIGLSLKLKSRVTSNLEKDFKQDASGVFSEQRIVTMNLWHDIRNGTAK